MDIGGSRTLSKPKLSDEAKYWWRRETHLPMKGIRSAVCDKCLLSWGNPIHDHRYPVHDGDKKYEPKDP